MRRDKRRVDFQITANGPLNSPPQVQAYTNLHSVVGPLKISHNLGIGSVNAQILGSSHFRQAFHKGKKRVVAAPPHLIGTTWAQRDCLHRLNVIWRHPSEQEGVSEVAVGCPLPHVRAGVHNLGYLVAENHDLLLKAEGNLVELLDVTDSHYSNHLLPLHHQIKPTFLSAHALADDLRPSLTEAHLQEAANLHNCALQGGRGQPRIILGRLLLAIRHSLTSDILEPPH
mmetsp:Transcript_36370/g.79416  ORF Transcript_36370/g.79416 Transcript_36370/m.79416 type:complete len:228 (-) Transcript_36370:563-1246(-)